MTPPRKAWSTPIDRAAPIDVDGARIRGVFDSWQSWVDYCDQIPPALPGKARTYSRETSEQITRWAGGTWADAVKLAREGYESAIVDTDSRARSLAFTVIGDKLSRDWSFERDVTGDAIDVAAYVDGVPESMIYATPADQHRTGEVVRLIVSATYNFGVDPDLVLARGAAIVALVDVLAQAGFSLEVWAHLALIGGPMPTADHKQARASFVIQCQRASDPLDIGTIAFALAHPSMLRRLGFSAMERVPPVFRRPLAIGRTYGAASNPLPDDAPPVDGPTITLEQCECDDDWSPETSRDWITATLDALETPI